MPIRGSAPWTLAIVGVTAFIVGALLLTVLDPVAQGLFASSLWQSDTQAGSDTLGWMQALWTYWPLFILLGFTMLVWIVTRRAG